MRLNRRGPSVALTSLTWVVEWGDGRRIGLKCAVMQRLRRAVALSAAHKADWEGENEP